MELDMFMSRNKCITSVSASVFLTFSYVASLYVWRSKFNRDHPSTIKRRFFSVSCMMLLAPFFVQYFFMQESLDKGNVYELLGLRLSGIIPASIIPLLLTVVLFMGPLSMQIYSGIWKIYAEPIFWISSWQDLVWLRNHVMAPLSEEWVFRACMMPLLLQCLEPEYAIFTGPLLFGVAHFHHMYEQIKSGFDFTTALTVSSFQFLYTTLFGAYSAFLFVRTGHFVAPLLAHMFCNHMGFPNFGEIGQFALKQRIVVICCFLLGFTLWCLLIMPLTAPEIYNNRLYWNT